MRLIPLLLLPSIALVAQAPAREDLVQRFNSELPGINQLLKELKTQEAQDRAQKLLPPTRPAFQGATLKDIAESVDNARGLAALSGLLAKTASACGQWEQAVAAQERRAQDARATLADLDKAQAVLAAQWKKVAQESGDYVAKNAPRQQELEASIKALKEDIDAVNTKKKTLDSKGIDELKARAAKAPQEEQELAQIVAALPVHKQNLSNAPKVLKLLADNRKEVEGIIKSAEEAEAKAKKAIADQNGEITQFNLQQTIKKVKIAGRKNWVDAVMHVPENITKQGGAEEQVAFLNRLLVLDPGNAGVQKALDNLKAGKEAFAKAAKPAKKKPTIKKP